MHKQEDDTTMDTKRFYNAKGELTSYGLSCGYIQRHELNGINITLWKEHNCYHVRGHNHNTSNRLFWNSYSTLTPARKDYNKAIRLYIRGV
jgi:hypothetical protein